MSGDTKVQAFGFEVFGKVQGVFFRKHTAQKAKSLKIRGWILNTSRGTVQGEAYGFSTALAEFKDWLAKEGSPKSNIERAVFSDIDVSKGKAYEDFTIRK
eukprot:gb/GEZN01016507.1/.p2 GENE.gb/GEZN01016507.1/~~gb/GEZN01016507.1/.p2  ORF type:complete len:100 (+),score=12.82 gb/GEZN01016507.1/:219-518(+)